MERQPMEPARLIPPPAETRRTRSRRKPGRVWALRGIPDDVRERVTRTARKLGVPIHEVVRAFLLHGLSEYEAGRLVLEPRPRTVRWTLFPPGKGPD